MAEYVDRGSVLRVAHTFRPEDKELAAALSNIPVADVAPVSHGRWVKKRVNGISRTEGQDSFAVGE